MAYTNPLIARWRSGPAFGFWCSTSNAAQAEYVVDSGIDWMAWDQQHGLVSDNDLAGLMRVVRGTNVAPVIRVGANDPLLIGRALDAGAAGVIIPLVNTADEAAHAVTACRFPPNGTRSFGPNRATIAMDSLDPRIIEDVACIVMVETAEGLANVEAIAATPGVDAIPHRSLGPRARPRPRLRRPDRAASGRRPADPRRLPRAMGSRPGSCWAMARRHAPTPTSGSGS